MADKGRRKADPRAEAEEFDVAPFVEEEREAAVREPAETAVEQREEARYFIDPMWYEERGLVFTTVAQARLCGSCSSKLGSFVEERYPVIDPKTKRVTFEFRKVGYGTNPLPIIRDCCSKARDYIYSDTPLLEAVFRVFLANGNQPMTLSTVREHLLTYLPEVAALRSDFPLSLLERVIKNDHIYGLREHRLPVAV